MSARAAKLREIATTRAERWALRGVSGRKSEKILAVLYSVACLPLLGAAIYIGNTTAFAIAGLFTLLTIFSVGRIILIRIIERQAEEIASLRGGEKG